MRKQKLKRALLAISVLGIFFLGGCKNTLAEVSANMTQLLNVESKSSLSEALSAGTGSFVPYPDRVEATRGVLGSVNISWKAVEDASSYTVYRADTLDAEAEGYYPIKEDFTGTIFSDTTAKPGIRYAYRVRAFLADGSGSDLSVGDEGYVLSPPSVITGSMGAFTDRIEVVWTGALGAEKFLVYRSTLPDRGYELLDKEMMDGFFADNEAYSTIEVNTHYFYRVVSVNKIGQKSEMAASPYAEGFVLSKDAPSPPGSVAASDATNSEEITITWVPSKNAAYYAVFRSGRKAGKYDRIALVKSGTAYTDVLETKDRDKTFYYKLCAFNDKDEQGRQSIADEGYRLMEPAATASVGGYTDKILVSWPEVKAPTKITDGVEISPIRYVIERKLDGEPEFVPLNTLDAVKVPGEVLDGLDRSGSWCSYLDEDDKILGGVSSDEAADRPFISYRVKAVFVDIPPTASEEWIEGNYSESQGKACLPQPPANVAATQGEIEDDMLGKIRVTWDAQPGFVYRILRKQPTESTFMVIEDSWSGGEYLDESLMDYYYNNFWEKFLPSLGGDSFDTLDEEFAFFLERFLTQYHIETVSFSGDDYSEPAEISGYKFINHKEFFYLNQFCDDTATKKLTNQNDTKKWDKALGNAPRDEWDGGYRSGRVDFSLDIGNDLKSAYVHFKFNQYSDYIGTKLDQEYISYQTTSLVGMTCYGKYNNSGFFSGSVNLDLSLKSDSSVGGGSVTVTLNPLGNKRFNSQELYPYYNSTKHCPGGRNRSGNSGGQYTNFDTGNEPHSFVIP